MLPSRNPAFHWGPIEEGSSNITSPLSHKSSINLLLEIHVGAEGSRSWGIDKAGEPGTQVSGAERPESVACSREEDTKRMEPQLATKWMVSLPNV